MPPPRSPGPLARWLLVATLVMLVASSMPPAPVGAQGGTWDPPVPGAVVREYREPVARFASGHRGVDYSAAPGSPVRVANDGRVTFAGRVSGSLHAVVEHTGGIRTSYSFLSRVDVQEGDAVRRGDQLGTAGGSGEGHRAGLLHFGARVGDRYFDPMRLFGPVDLTELVRLVPSGRPVPPDRTLLLWEIENGNDDSCAGGIPFVEQICDVGEAVGGFVGGAAEEVWEKVEDTVELGLAALRAVKEIAEELIDQVETVVRDVLRTLRDVAEKVAGAVEELAVKIANGAVAVFNAVVEAGLKLYENLTSCPQPPPAAHIEGSGNLAVAVGGLGSSRRRRSAAARDPYDESFQTRWRMLGYARDEVEHFSYAADSPTYDAKDTYGDLHDQARSLGRQLKEATREHPGMAIDLVGHSQGGVVIDLFLSEVYRGHEAEYPPIENVLTFASPHEGTPLADLHQEADRNLIFGPVARALDQSDLFGATSINQMAEDSDTIEGLWGNGGVPPEIRFLSIIGAEDPIVPSSSADVPGATKVVVPAGDTLVPDDHSAVLRDDDAMSAAQAHLSGRSPADTCGAFTDLGGLLYSELVRKVTEKAAELPGGTDHPVLNPEYLEYLP
jgi:hypothetical protein